MPTVTMTRHLYRFFPLLENRTQLLLIGGGAAVVLVVFGLYALSGAGSIRRGTRRRSP